MSKKKTDNRVIQVISHNATMEMVVIKTPMKGVTTRTGKPAFSSVTVHRKRKPKAKK